MKHMRSILGVLALLGLAAGLNVIVFQRNPFDPKVLIPLAFGAVCGLIWLVWSVSSLAESIERGRTVASINVVVSSLAFMGICILIYAFLRHQGYSWDLTQEGRKPLSDQTIRVLESLEKDVEVFGLFLSTGDEQIDTTKEKARRFLERCQHHTRHLNVEFFDPQLDSLKFESLGIKRVSKQGTIVVKCGTREPRVITLSGITARLEERDFTNALINVARDAEPKLYALTGHGEADLNSPEGTSGMSELKARLEAESYALAPWTINVLDPRIPPDCDVLLLLGPARDFQPAEVKVIDEYLARGGRMLVMVEPWRVLNSGVAQEHFRPWLKERFGIRIGSDIILSRAQKAEDIVNVVMTPDFGLLGLADPNGKLRGSYSDEHPITRGFDENMVLNLSRSVTLSDEMPERVVGDTLLWSLPETWAESNMDLLYNEKKADPGPMDLKGPFGVAVAVSVTTDVAVDDSARTREARIVAVGDVSFASNKQVRIVGHLNFMLNSVAWLTENEELIAIRPTGKEDPAIQLTDSQERAIAWIVILGSLQVLAAVGLLIYAVRRRYQ